MTGLGINAGMERYADLADRREHLLEDLLAGVPRPEEEALLLVGRFPPFQALDRLALLLLYPERDALLRLDQYTVERTIGRTLRRTPWDPRRMSSMIDQDREWLSRADRHLVWAGDDDYPGSLHRIYDFPAILYARGDRTILSGGAPRIAIVGTREPDNDGLLAAYNLAGELAGRGVAVVSGLARGIDGAAHRGVVARGKREPGRTIAVLGSGIDTIYPKEHRELALDILRHDGLIVSEYAPGRRAARFQFPARNRIVVGFSDGVVLGQAPERSGALISADLAHDIGVEVMVHRSGASWTGGASLVDAGATVVETADEVLAAVGTDQTQFLGVDVPGSQIIVPAAFAGDERLTAFGPEEDVETIAAFREGQRKTRFDTGEGTW